MSIIFCLSYNKQLGDNSLLSAQASCAGFAVVCVCWKWATGGNASSILGHHPNVPCATRTDLVFAEQELKPGRWACKVSLVDHWWESLSLLSACPWGSRCNQAVLMCQVPLIHIGDLGALWEVKMRKAAQAKPLQLCFKWLLDTFNVKADFLFCPCTGWRGRESLWFWHSALEE